ncbi:MAG TPA: PstS family phosphate ABC transporter substrate-binding protein [Verrucomicrobiae bacterium]|nr:PstS family phosphate ABC transporter substrate-binding protein [Verrucomicrobiae bacterium]
MRRVLEIIPAVILWGALAAPAASARPPMVTVDGSSTLYPVTEAVAEEFQKTVRREIRVTVGISGTGGGFKKFCRGETDITDASRPILSQEMQACRTAGIRFIEIPVAYDALVVVTHPENHWLKSITLQELKKLWEPAAQQRVSRWNQVNPAWPDAPVKLFGPGADSGTFDYFTEAVTGRAKASRGDYTASEDDNVLVQGVSRDRNSLGYFGYAYYLENRDKVRAVAVAEAPGAAGVLPTPEAVHQGTYRPLSRPVFIYVRADALRRSEVRKFVEFYLTHAAELAREVRFVPLPDRAYAVARRKVAAGKTGTAFSGSAEPGVRVEDLLQRQGLE